MAGNGEEMEEGNYLLIAVVGFLALCALNGYRKGFLKIALSLAAMAATIILVGILNPYVSRFLMNNTGLYETLKDSTEEFVDEVFERELGAVIQTRTDEVFAIDHLTLPKVIREKLIEDNNSVIYEALGVNSFKEYISSYLACLMLNIISFIGTFLVAGFLVGVVFVMADIIERVPVIHGINKTAGLAIGLIQGIVIIWIACLVVTAFGATKTGQHILALIQENMILSFIYDHNGLMLLVGNILKMFGSV